MYHDVNGKAYLHGHRHVRWPMKDLLDCAVCAFAEFVLKFHLAHIDRVRGSVGEIDAGCMEDGLSGEIEPSGRIAAMEVSGRQIAK